MKMLLSVWSACTQIKDDFKRIISRASSGLLKTQNHKGASINDVSFLRAREEGAGVVPKRQFIT